MWLLRQPEHAFRALFQLEIDAFCVGLGVVGCVLSLFLANWRRRLTCMTTVAAFAFGVSLAAHGNVPLTLAFAASKVELARVAKRVRAEPSVGFQGRAGTYDIVSTSVSSAGVVLSLVAPDESGSCAYGFVQTVDDETPTATALGLRDVVVEKLTGGRYVYYDRYWSVKVGWS